MGTGDDGARQMTAKRALDFDLGLALSDPGFTPRVRDVRALLDHVASGDEHAEAAERALLRVGAQAGLVAAERAPEAVPIERYAGISAALSRKGVDRSSVLRAQKLTIAGWGAIDRHWKRALAEQTDRGEKTLLQAFDIAYVSAQGELHRPVGVREYARILIGLERGEIGRVLAALELQLSDLMRFQRVWSKRVADSPDLAAELAVALEEARKA